MTLNLTSKQVPILADILDDYLRMVGKDKDRRQRIATATKILDQISLGLAPKEEA